MPAAPPMNADQRIRAHRQQVATGHRRTITPVGDTWKLDLVGMTRPLSLNDRAHWRVRARSIARVRELAYTAAVEAGVPECSAVDVVLHYAPRDNRRRDPLNLAATIKPVQDGIVDALVVPDDTPEFMPLTHPVIADPTHEQTGRLWVVVRSLWSCAQCGAHAGRPRGRPDAETCLACAMTPIAGQELHP